jgi:hypothetical protein
MPSSKTAPRVDEAVAEGIAPPGGQGTKPRRRIGLKSILERIDELEYIVQERGLDEGFDPKFEAKRGALLGLLTYYEALRAPDDQMSLLKKADLVPRMVPFLNYLKELTPKGEERFPATEKMIDKEMDARAATIAKLIRGNAATEKVLEVMAPAVKQPSEEA